MYESRKTNLSRVVRPARNENLCLSDWGGGHLHAENTTRMRCYLAKLGGGGTTRLGEVGAARRWGVTSLCAHHGSASDSIMTSLASAVTLEPALRLWTIISHSPSS